MYKSSKRNNWDIQPQSIFRLMSPYWLACVPLAAIITIVWNVAAHAQDAKPLTPEDVQGALNAIWVLIAAILVIFMNAGFCMLETGFCRQKNAVNVLAKNLIVFALATVAYWAIGYSLMFGASGSPFIGLGGWFLSGDYAAYGLTPFPGGIPVPLHFFFQVAFAGTAATIVSGAVAERIKFVSFLIFSLLLVGISYSITGHWIWAPDGWLFTMGFKDFAGSTAVHSVGGWAALVGAAVLGPRQGKYSSDGKNNAIPGHNMSIATLGCLILWVCWFGFNGGSTLAANEDSTYIALTTNLGGAAGGIVGTVTAWIKFGKPDLSMIINGILAGLVSVTAGCNPSSYSYWDALIVGAIGGALVVFAVGFFDSIKVDDPVGATSVHLVCGVWGTLAVGILGDGNIVTQIVGIATVGGFTTAFSFIAWYALKATLGIRVSTEEEHEGLDIGEHGMEAYAGFVKEADILAGGANHAYSGVGNTANQGQ